MTPPLGIQGSLQKALNSHGYGLHYAIIHKMEELVQGAGFPWRLAAVELPVEVRGEHTRIDIVLKHVRRSVYVVCECKRVNPALSEWAFFKAPYTTPQTSSRWILTESIMFDGQNNLQSNAIRLDTSDRIFHVAFEMKSDKTGDQYGHGRGGIEGASTQVVRSLNGFIHFFNNHRELLVVNDPTPIIPLVFTTASLHTTDADLGEASLETGEVDLASANVEEVEWLYYQYNQTPGLRHAISNVSQDASTISEVLQSEFTRTIAIVNPKSLEAFLRNLANI